MSKYIPPALRNKQPEPEMDKPQRIHERMSERRRNRNFQKPQWEIQEEEDKKKADEKKRAEERGLEKTEENFPSLGGSAPRVNTWGGGRKFSELASEWKEQAADMNLEVVDKEEHFVLPKFRNIHRFIEPEDDRPPPPEKPEDKNDGWITVEKKIKKNGFKSIFDDDGNLMEEDTVWGGEEQEETCWND